MKVLGLVDSSYYLHRAWSVSAASQNIEHLSRNTVTRALSGIVRDLLDQKCTHALACFEHKKSWRHEIYPEYKMARKDSKIEITRRDGQVITLQEGAGAHAKALFNACKFAGLTAVVKKLYEADDLIGSAAEFLAPEFDRIVIFTRDKDLHQLINDKVTVFWPKEKKRMTAKDVVKHWGVKPEQLLDYLTLTGDAVDNVPGVPNIADKTAVKILTECGSIQAALKHDKFSKKLLPHKRTIALSRKLISLRKDLEFEASDCVIANSNKRLLEFVWKEPPTLSELQRRVKNSTSKSLF